MIDTNPTEPFVLYLNNDLEPAAKSIATMARVTYPDGRSVLATITKNVTMKDIAPKRPPLSAEEALQQALDRVLGKYADLLNGYVKRGSNIPKSFYADMESDLQAVLAQKLTRAFIVGALNAQSAIDKAVPIEVDWAAPNADAMKWVKQYTFDLVRGLTDTTSAQVQANIAALQDDVSAFFGKPTTLAELRGNIGQYIPDWQDRLGRVWSTAERSEMIAVTETTRASVQGNLASVQFLSDEYGIALIPVWQTSNDEKVCPICGPLHNQKQGTSWDEPPPAHPRCRCMISFEMP